MSGRTTSIAEAVRLDVASGGDGEHFKVFLTEKVYNAHWKNVHQLPGAAVSAKRDYVVNICHTSHWKHYTPAKRLKLLGEV